MSPDTPNAPCAQASWRVDARLVFLIRAAVRFDLVEAGEFSLDEAFDGLMPALGAIECLTDSGVAP